MFRPVPPISLVVLATVSAALLASSCKSRENKAEPADQTPETVTQRSTALGLRTLTPEGGAIHFQKPPELPTFEPIVLLSPGKGKRTALRYTLGPGRHEFTMQARVTVREYIGGTWSESRTLPEIQVGIDVMRLEGRSDFQVRGLDAVIAAPEDGTDAKALTDAARNFLTRYRDYAQGRRATVTLDERGRLGDVLLSPETRQGEDSRYVKAELVQMLLEQTVPLPEEPVAVGAKWRAVTLMFRGAAVIKQTDDFELESVDGNRAVVAVTSTQIGEHQAVGGPDLPPGHRAEMVALFKRSTGKQTLDLGVPLPVSATMDTELRVHGRLIDMATGKETDYFLDNKGTLERTATARDLPGPASAPDVPDAPDAPAGTEASGQTGPAPRATDPS